MQSEQVDCMAWSGLYHSRPSSITSYTNEYYYYYYYSFFYIFFIIIIIIICFCLLLLLLLLLLQILLLIILLVYFETSLQYCWVCPVSLVIKRVD